ncbi:hypothetical protein U8V72_18320 [Priestia filamentosa]|uniref:hypothetical protein n=1 Tax=Priestia filamentosa TaxID=1402861 RepID=UPI0012E02C70
MLYEKKDIQKDYESIISQTDSSYFLIACSYDAYQVLTRNEFLVLNVKWRTRVKASIDLEDRGYMLNGGNIFVEVHNSRKGKFLNEVLNISFTKMNKSGIHTKVLELNKNEIHTFIM